MQVYNHPAHSKTMLNAKGIWESNSFSPVTYETYIPLKIISKLKLFTTVVCVCVGGTFLLSVLNSTA